MVLLVQPAGADGDDPSPLTIEKLKAAVNERHDAVENAYSKAFSIMKDYHDHVMPDPNSEYIYMDQGSGVPEYFLVPFVKDDFPDLSAEFNALKYKRFEEAMPHLFPWHEEPAPEDESDEEKVLREERNAASEAAATANKENTKQLTADAVDAYDAQYPPGSDLFENLSPQTQSYVDPISAREEYWQWWADNRKSILEGNGEIEPPSAFGETKSTRLGELSAEDIGKLNDEWKAAVEDERSRLEAIRVAAAGGQTFSFGSAEELETQMEPVTQWIQDKAEWEEKHAIDLEKAQANDLEKAPLRVNSYLNSPSYRARKSKGAYLSGLLLSKTEGFYPCGAEYKPATINWEHNSVDMSLEESLEVLNQIARETERLAQVYLSVPPIGEREDDENYFNAAESDGRVYEAHLIGPVTRDNYRAQMIRIASLLNRMETLPWPCLTRMDRGNYYSETSISVALNAGEFGDGNYFGGAHTSGPLVKLIWGIHPDPVAGDSFGAPHRKIGQLSTALGGRSGIDGNTEATAVNDFATLGSDSADNYLELEYSHRSVAGRYLKVMNPFEDWTRVRRKPFTAPLATVLSRKYQYTVSRNTADQLMPTIHCRLDGQYHGTVPAQSFLPGFNIVGNDVIFTLAKTPWLPTTAQEETGSFSATTDYRLLSKQSFSVRFDLSGFSSPPFSPNISVSNLGKACRVLFPLDNSSMAPGDNPVLSLNLSSAGSAAPYHKYKPFWNLISITGDTSALEVKSGPPHLGMTSFMVEEDGMVKAATDLAGLGDRDRLLSAPIVEIRGSKVALELEWQGPYCLAAVYKSIDGNDTFATYTVKVPGLEEGVFYKNGISTPGNEHPSLRTIEIQHSENPIANIAFAPDDSQWSYTDLASGAVQHIILEEEEEEEPDTELVVGGQTLASHLDDPYGSFIRIGVDGEFPVWPEYGTWQRGDKSTQAVFTDEESDFPSSITYAGPDHWARAGDVEEFESDGSLKAFHFKIAGMPAVREWTFAQDTLTEKLTVAGSLLSEAITTYEDEGAKVTTASNGSSVVREYYTGSANNGLPWHVKSVENFIGEDSQGKTAYTYKKVENENETTIDIESTFTPATEGEAVTLKVSYLPTGAFSDSEVKIGNTPVSKVTATKHEDGYLGRPTEFAIKQGFYTANTSRKFDANGNITNITHANGRVDILKPDEFGRPAAGTELDGVKFSPDYSDPLNPSLNFGGKEISSSRTIEGETTSSESDFGYGIRHDRPAGSLTANVTILGQGNRSTSSEVHPDGSPKTVAGGLGRPGSQVDYSIEAVDDVNCLAVTTTILDAAGQPSQMWEKRFTDGYGQLRKVERPHPSGDGTAVATTYEYDLAAKTVTIKPPAPSKPVTISTIDVEGGQKTTVTAAGQTYETTSTIANGQHTDTVTHDGVEISKTETNIATGAVESSYRERWVATATPAPDGMSLTATGRYGSELQFESDKDGPTMIEIKAGGETMRQDFNSRNKFGNLVEASVDPPGPIGPHNVTYNEYGEIASIKGPAVDITSTNSFPDGGDRVETTDAISGESFASESDAEGHIRELDRPGKLPLAIEGDIRDGQITVELPGIANQEVDLTFGPTGDLLAHERNDGSGYQYVLHDDGSYDRLTRYDSANVGGVHYEFDFTEHPVTGLPTGFNGPGCSQTVSYHNDGTVASIDRTSSTFLGPQHFHSTAHPEYFEGRPKDDVHSGLLSGLKVSRTFDPETGELRKVAVLDGGNLLHEVEYKPDDDGRLHQVIVTDGVTATYSYDSHETTLQSSLATTTRTIKSDGTGLLKGIETRAGPGNLTYDASVHHNGRRIGNQTLRAPGRDDLRWTYTYGDDQLQKAVSNSGDRFHYEHGIRGNRDELNANDYNQYQLFRSPSGVTYDVIGRAAPGAEVFIRRGAPGPGITLGGTPVLVNGDGSFRARFAEETGPAAVTIPIKVVAILRGQGTNGTDAVSREDRQIVLPASEGILTYGAHGALAGDLTWIYHWNTEGRLHGMETRDTAVASGLPNIRLQFSYDHQGRRIWKQADYLSPDGNTIERTVTTRFVYDGWLLLAELIEDTVEEVQPVTTYSARYYTWGSDLSGSLQGAGGVGGLITITEDDGSPVPTTYSPVYDASGNIIALTGANGQEVAYWRRGPFGEIIESGGATEKCPFGFATHYTDVESGLVYFGYRYYSPPTGRWLSREPLGEFESFNLYAYCHNDPINKYDVLGLEERKILLLSGESFLIDAVGVEQTEFLKDHWGIEQVVFAAGVGSDPNIEWNAAARFIAANEFGLHGKSRQQSLVAEMQFYLGGGYRTGFAKFSYHDSGRELYISPIRGDVVNGGDSSRIIGLAMFDTYEEFFQHVWGEAIIQTGRGRAFVEVFSSAHGALRVPQIGGFIESGLEALKSLKGKFRVSSQASLTRIGPTVPNSLKDVRRIQITGGGKVTFNGVELPPSGQLSGNHFHGLSVPPGVSPTDFAMNIRKNGLASKGTNLDLQAHSRLSPETGFRGATPLQGVARDFAGEGGVVVKIGGVDYWNLEEIFSTSARNPALKTLLFTDEVERAIHARVLPESIERVGIVVNGVIKWLN